MIDDTSERKPQNFEDWLKALTPEQVAVAEYLAGTPRAMYDRIREVMERPQQRQIK